MSWLYNILLPMKWNLDLWRKSVEEFKDFMLPVVATLGRSERRVAATAYIEGLLIPGKRKSIEPMAKRVGVDSQKLQQFMTDSPWDEEAVWKTIRREIVPHLEPLDAWVVDETGWLKQGRHSVGVRRQYCGSVGKVANCQVSVEVAVSCGGIAAPVAGRLYLPEKWSQDRSRLRRARVPKEIEFATKPKIALELIRQTLADGVAKAPVLGDAVYGDGFGFREELRRLGMEFFLQVTPTMHTGWDYEVETEMKRTRRRVSPTAEPTQTLQEMALAIEPKDWKKCVWTAVGGETRKTRIAWKQVYLASRLRLSGGDLEKVWLVVDWPEGDEAPYHCYLAHLHSPPTKAQCLKLSRSRWQIEQYFKRAKDDLGLDHYEGRSWPGFHHHLVLSALAYLFVLTVYLRSKKNFWAHVGTDAPCDPPVLAEINRILLLLRDDV